MTRRSYSGNAPATTLSGAINAAVTSITVADGTGYPTGSAGPFVITIDATLSTEEKILCSSRTGNTLTASSRGWDGTTAASHANSAVVQHTISATDLDEANAHVNATSAAHAASAISSTATGDVSATNVQAAIAELASEKLSAATAAATYALIGSGGTANVASGTYTGDGSTNRTIALSFTPKLVICMADTICIGRLNASFAGFRITTAPAVTQSTLNTVAPHPTTNGFIVSGGSAGDLNTGSWTYLALG